MADLPSRTTRGDGDEIRRGWQGPESTQLTLFRPGARSIAANPASLRDRIWLTG